MTHERTSPEREAVSTLIVSALGEDLGASVSALLERHRGYLQHQLVCLTDQAADGEWLVSYIPDSDRIASNLRVDTGFSLEFDASRSAELKFTAALRGIVLSEVVPGDAGVAYTFLLTSTIGNLINSGAVAVGDGGPLTAEEVKILYESNPDTNEFSNAEQTKLAGIEAGADVTDAASVEAAGAAMVVDLDDVAFSGNAEHLVEGATNKLLTVAERALIASAIVDADFSASEGIMQKLSAGTYTTIKTNLAAAVDPTVTDDSSLGYGNFSPWVNTTANPNKLFICKDPAVGAADWQQVASGTGGGMAASVKTANYTITASEDVGVDSSGGAFTVELKASPSAGDVAFIHDVADSCSTNNVTIDRNGSTINGLSEDALLDVDSGAFWFIYDGSTWVFTPIISGGVDEDAVDERVGIYRPAGVRYNGSTQYYNKVYTSAGNDVTGVARFRIGTFTTNYGHIIGADGSTQDRCSLSVGPTDAATADEQNKLIALVKNSAGTTICRLVSIPDVNDLLDHTAFFAFDGDAGTAIFYVDGVDADDTGASSRVAPTTGTLQTGATSRFVVGRNAAAGGTSGQLCVIGFVGMRDAYLTNPLDFMHVGGLPKDINITAWTQWGAQPLFWNANGQMDRNSGSAGPCNYPVGMGMSFDQHGFGDALLPLGFPGTFTPVLWDDSLANGEGQTYTVQSGNYRKIFDICFFTVELTVNSIGTLTTTQAARIGGFPFTASAAYAAACVAYGASLNITAGNKVTAQMAANTRYLELHRFSAATGTSFLPVGGVSAGGQLTISGWYITVD